MSKIICEICGTTYQDTASCCPICGCSREDSQNLSAEEMDLEEVQEEVKVPEAAVVPQKKKDIFDYDKGNTPSEDEEEDDDEDEDDEDDEDYDEEEEEDEARPNTFVVILLTILIVCLLVAAGFIFVKYFLPNMGDKEPTATAAATVAQPTEAAESTEATVPCERIIMDNEAKAELSHYGQQFLLNVKAIPENTTDKIVFTSADESIAVVTEDGKITAIAEGETEIIISCGKNSIPCTVVVKFVAETVPTEAPEETVPAETGAEETAPDAVDPDETVPEETTGSDAAVDPNVVLKLKKTDIKLGVYYYFTLELDCELDPTQVQWSSEHPHIAKVDEKGVVTAMQEGTTAITAKYGDQEVTCMVRCGWY